jgi:PAS domain S-box-containing protein
MQDSQLSTTALKVVVADDMAASREHLCDLLRDLGHEVFDASGGAAALALVMAHDPDLMLLDLLMPDMNGIEVIQQLRSRVTQRWLPVIVTSSLEGDEHFINALECGADDYLTRPINPGLLAAQLRHYARVLALQSDLAVLARRQRDIHNNILDAVITLDDTGCITEGNLAAQRLFGSGTNALEGQSCQAALGVPLTELLTQREISLRKPDGTIFPAELGLSAWTDAGSARYTMVLRDLTERRHMERMKDEFLATVSHELRTPLTSVLGALGLLASGAAGALPKAALPLAEVAKRNGERLSRLIDDILDLTKLEGKQLLLQLRALRLGPLLVEAIAANQGYAERAGVKLQLDHRATDPLVRVDADRFLQIMANLLSNAIKHSRAGDTVRVSVDRQGALLRISVRDQGPGIDPQFRSRMFEKFSQADSSDRRAQGGTGLGLYITRLLAERMSARVAVDSVAGEGATFIVEFPIFDASAPVPAPWLLHIDSDVDARARVADWLSVLCPVESVADLQQARQALTHLQAPIILADPQAQGSAEEFCNALRPLSGGNPVMLYSDAVDAAFVARMGLAWLPKSSTGRQALLDAARQAILKIKPPQLP